MGSSVFFIFGAKVLLLVELGYLKSKNRTDAIGAK